MMENREEQNIQEENRTEEEKRKEIGSEIRSEIRKEKTANKGGRLQSSTFAKIIAFFMLAISFAVGAFCSLIALFLWDWDAYTDGVEKMTRDRMISQIWEDQSTLVYYYEQGNIEGMESYLASTNLSAEIYEGIWREKEGDSSSLLWSNYDGTETAFSYTCYSALDMPVEEFGEEVEPEADAEINKAAETMEVTFRFYLDDAFPVDDAYKERYTQCQLLGEYMYVVLWGAVSGMFLALCCFIFLMCSAGHHRDQEGITPGVLYNFHFDIVTVVFGAVALFILLVMANCLDTYSLIDCIALVIIATMEVVWCTIYCMEFAVHLKLGSLWENMLIYQVIKAIWKGVKAVFRGIGILFKNLPVLAGVLIGYFVLCIVEFCVLLFLIVTWYLEGSLLLLLVLEKAVLLPIILYFALMCKRLQKGGKELAKGNLSYKVDTSHMIFAFKEHGESLNAIGQGISLAVEDRMRSEHLKTELITNVSHDLKTPLTSIINYADLIGQAVKEEATEGTEVSEYSDVLLRQSKRLKKLLEDLLEASKATTGNLEVNLMPCEISVLLSQAVGEYEQRFAEKNLTLIVKQSEEPLVMQADGKHLWRVFDNLLNNICKYTQENTRVYLTVEKTGVQVKIVFRNMSKYPLEMSAEELQERFVRGDKSRHMEGNGLGLSIAGSLVELQNGKMEIVTDGDLFKVILTFPLQ